MEVTHANLCQSLVLWLVFHSTTLQTTSATTVYLNYSRDMFADYVMPDVLNITFYTDSVNLTQLHMKRVNHIDPNLPIFTLKVDEDGRYVYKQEQLEENQNVAFYCDIGNEALIQATRTKGLGEGEAHLVLKGELILAGRKYTLSPVLRVKRDGSQSFQPQPSTHSSGEQYSLLLKTTSPVVTYDYLDAPPEFKGRSVEAAQPEMPRTLLTATSSTLQPQSETTSSPPPLSNRHRRQAQAGQNCYVDVVAVTDLAIYNRFMSSSGSRAQTLQAMREYYAFIFYGVDLRYQSVSSVKYVIHVRLIKILITETAAASTFTERFRVSNKPWDEVDAQSVLASFSEYAAGSGIGILSPYDHAMLFTGLDLTSTVTPLTKTNATTGLAFTSTLCRLDGKSVSVVEDLGGFQAVDTAAHELGHSLSARHDGDGNTCHTSDRYIMANGSSKVTENNRFNPWRFSSCSIVSFVNFISSSIQTARGRTCLLSSLSISGVPDVTNRLPGQEFSPDDQCRMIYGSSSRLCRGTEFASTASVCISMFCFDPSTTGICYEQTAAMGTTCGDGKLCLNGQCVLDPRAPAADDNCLFGDQPDIAFDGMTCPTFVEGFRGYCYQALVRGRCCASCMKIYRTVTDCEYGDKVRGCVANVCIFGSADYLQKCCGTCNYGSTFTVPTMPTQVSSTIRNKTPSAGGVTTQQTMTSTVIIHINPGICVDSSNILFDGLSCAEAVLTHPWICYETNVNIACCASCDKTNTGVAGTQIGGQVEYENNVVDGGEVEANEVKEESEEQNEEDGENEINHQGEEEDEIVVEEEGTDNDKKGEEEIENKEILEGEDGRNDTDQEEMMAKIYVALSIHINLGCEYGDLVPSSCTQAKSCQGVASQCCQTCNTSVKPSNATAPTLPCIDQHNVLVNEMTCETIIKRFPFYCYNAQVLKACCLSCKQKHSGIRGCEYGDHVPQKCKSRLLSEDCYRLKDECCATCFSGAQRTIITALLPLFMILCSQVLSEISIFL